MPNHPVVDRLDIERKGGFAGMGGPGSRIRSRGSLDVQSLSPSERTAIDALFSGADVSATGPSAAAADSPVRDGFQYHLSRMTPDGLKTRVLPEERVPQSVRDAVHDELE